MGVSAAEASAGAPAAAPPRAGARGGIAGALHAALTRLALGAPARVFVLAGIDPPASVDELRLRDDVQLVDTPRSATVLLVAGRLPEVIHEAAMRAHAAMAHPRAVVWWTRETPPGDAGPFSAATIVRHAAGDAPDVLASDDVLAQLAAVLCGVHAALVRGDRGSDAALLPNVAPAPWRGVGPYGQGGAGMTGGVPYGRPMAGRAPDRDGLELDQLPVRVGPFFVPFPAGLVLDVRLQGDVVQEAMVPGNAFATPIEAAQIDDRLSTAHPFHAALHHPVPIADLERARARHHLRWLSHALRIHGLEALARRTLALVPALARELPAGLAADVAALGRLLEQSRALGWATAGVGVTEATTVAGRGLGPVARAAGLAEDARLDDAAYAALDFTPTTQQRRRAGASRHALGDARDRWRQRLAEVLQSLDLAARAGDRRTGGRGAPVEGPRGRLYASGADAPPSAALLTLLPDLLRGQEWGDAVTTIVSLDIDMGEAAPGAAPLAPPPGTEAGGMGGGMAGGGDEHAHHGHSGRMK